MTLAAIVLAALSVPGPATGATKYDQIVAGSLQLFMRRFAATMSLGLAVGGWLLLPLPGLPEEVGSWPIMSTVVAVAAICFGGVFGAMNVNSSREAADHYNANLAFKEELHAQLRALPPAQMSVREAHRRFRIGNYIATAPMAGAITWSLTWHPNLAGIALLLGLLAFFWLSFFLATHQFLDFAWNRQLKRAFADGLNLATAILISGAMAVVLGSVIAQRPSADWLEAILWFVSLIVVVGRVILVVARPSPAIDVLHREFLARKLRAVENFLHHPLVRAIEETAVEESPAPGPVPLVREVTPEADDGGRTLAVDPSVAATAGKDRARLGAVAAVALGVGAVVGHLARRRR